MDCYRSFSREMVQIKILDIILKFKLIFIVILLLFVNFNILLNANVNKNNDFKKIINKTFTRILILYPELIYPIKNNSEYVINELNLDNPDLLSIQISINNIINCIENVLDNKDKQIFEENLLKILNTIENDKEKLKIVFNIILKIIDNILTTEEYDGSIPRGYEL